MFDAAQQFPTTSNNKESNMNNHNNHEETEMKDGVDYMRELEMKIVKLEEEAEKRQVEWVTRLAADTAQIKELEARIDNDAAQITHLDKAREDYRKLYNTSVEDVRDNVSRIEEVLHSHARDCDDQALIDGLIEQINAATRNGFPELRKCNRTWELTITYTVDVKAASEEDARDKFDEGDYDHLIDLRDFYDLDVEEGY